MNELTIYEFYVKETNLGVSPSLATKPVKWIYRFYRYFNPRACFIHSSRPLYALIIGDGWRWCYIPCIVSLWERGGERERARTATDRKQPGALSIMKIPPPLGLFYGPASMIGLHRLQRLHWRGGGGCDIQKQISTEENCAKYERESVGSLSWPLRLCHVM